MLRSAARENADIGDGTPFTLLTCIALVKINRQMAASSGSLVIHHAAGIVCVKSAGRHGSSVLVANVPQ